MRFSLAIAALLCAGTLAARVIEVDIDGIVHPVTVEIVSSALARAEAQHADALIVRLSTAGGLPDSTREIAERIFHSRVPVIVWVGPSGARAYSAGFILLEAGDVAAMAPGARTGTSRPVSPIGMRPGRTARPGVVAETPDAAGRAARALNANAAEKTGRPGASYSDREAVDRHLIDIIAPDPASLLRALDGREITRFDGRRQTLHFPGAADTAPELFMPALRERILSAIADPNIALLLLAFGTLGVYAEFCSPGLVLPGVLGASLLLLGLAALAMFPIGWLGAALIVLALALFVMEARFATRGILMACGAMAIVFGAPMLIDTNEPALKIRAGMAFGVAIPFAIVTSFLLSIAQRARRNKDVTGPESARAACPAASGISVSTPGLVVRPGRARFPERLPRVLPLDSRAGEAS